MQARIICTQNNHRQYCNVHYFHYIQNQKFNNPTKIEGYTMCENIIKFTTDSYIRRLNKMKEQPIFLWDNTKHFWYNPNNISIGKILKSIKTKYTIVLYDFDVETHTEDNMIYLNKSKEQQEVNESAADIYKQLIKNYDGQSFII